MSFGEAIDSGTCSYEYSKVARKQVKDMVKKMRGKGDTVYEKQDVIAGKGVGGHHCSRELETIAPVD